MANFKFLDKAGLQQYHGLLIAYLGNNFVKYVSQTLTPEQQAQARLNIGAGTSDFTGYSASNKLTTDYIQNDAGWTSNAGTVTGVAVNGTTYSPTTEGLVTLPDYPTVGSLPYVRYDETQSLTTAQKQQARENIAAGTYSKPSGGIPVSDLAIGSLSITQSITTETDKIPSSNAVKTFVEGKGYGNGTVTSVSAGTGLSVSNPTTTPTISIASGYKLPTTTEWTNLTSQLVFTDVTIG